MGRRHAFKARSRNEGLRSQLNKGMVAGAGTKLAFVDKEEMYEDNQIDSRDVRMPHDRRWGYAVRTDHENKKENEYFDQLCKEMSGEVKTYKL